MNDKSDVQNGFSASSLCSIDRRMVPSKISYFMFYAAQAQYGWYINIFLTSIGLSTTEAGFITGLCFMSSTIAGPIWGALNDYTGRRKLIFIVVCLCTTFSFFCLPWVAVAVSDDGITLKSNETSNYTRTSKNHTKIYTNDRNPKEQNFTSNLFWVMLFCLLLVNTFLNPLAGLLDSMVMGVIKRYNNVPSYGLQRLYGSLGGGLTPLLAGILSDHYYSKTMSKYTAVFFLYMPCMALVLPAGWYLLKQGEGEEKGEQCESVSDDGCTEGYNNELFYQLDNVEADIAASADHHEKSVYGSNLKDTTAVENSFLDDDDVIVVKTIQLTERKLTIVEDDDKGKAKQMFKKINLEDAKDTKENIDASDSDSDISTDVNRTALLLNLLKNPDNCVFFLTVLIEGILLAITQYFLSLTMTNEMGASATAGGVAILIHGLAEMMMFPFGKRIICLLGGPINSMQLGLFCYAVRHILISVITNQWLVVIPQLLNSITFALFIEAIMEYTQRIAPKEIYTLVFTTIFMLHASLSGLLANIVGGVIYNHYNGHTLYRWSGCLAFLWFIFLFLYFNGFKKIKSCLRRNKRV